MSSQPTEITGDVIITDGCLHVENDDCCPLYVAGCVEVSNCDQCTLAVEVANDVPVTGTVGVTGIVDVCIKNKSLCAITEENLNRGLIQTYSVEMQSDITNYVGSITVSITDSFYVKSLLFALYVTDPPFDYNNLFTITVNSNVILSGQLSQWPGTITELSIVPGVSLIRFNLILDEIYGCLQLTEDYFPLVNNDVIEASISNENIQFATFSVSGCARCGQRSCNFSCVRPEGETFEQNLCSGDSFVKDLRDLVTIPDNNVCQTGSCSSGSCDGCGSTLDNLLYSWTVSDECGTIIGATSQAVPSENSIIDQVLIQGNTGATGPCRVTYVVTVYNNGCSSAPFPVYVDVYPNVTVTVSGLTGYGCCNIELGTQFNLTATVSPLTPDLTYQWTYNGVPVEGQTGLVFNATFGQVDARCGETAAVCILVTSPESGCTATGCLEITINPQLLVEIDQTACFQRDTPESEPVFLNATLTANVTGGVPPYVYQWFYSAACDENYVLLIPTTQSIDVTDAGCYQVLVIDEDNCTATAYETVPFDCN